MAGLLRCPGDRCLLEAHAGCWVGVVSDQPWPHRLTSIVPGARLDQAAAQPADVAVDRPPADLHAPPDAARQRCLGTRTAVFSATQIAVLHGDAVHDPPECHAV
jgi:hypothetical protein